MGFFSWKTADRNQSIANRHSRRFRGRPVYLLQPDGKPYTIFHFIPFMPAIEHLGVRWDDPLQQFGGKSANALVEEGRFARQKLPAPRVPLKFSFNKEARYEDLPASDVCPQQGFFYD